jgi:hypothetical protein
MGDMNIDIDNAEQWKTISAYLDIFHENGINQHIKHLTRIAGKSSSIIDHICSNIINDNAVTGVIQNDVTDHFATFMACAFQPEVQQNETIEWRDLGTNSMKQLNQW